MQLALHRNTWIIWEIRAQRFRSRLATEDYGGIRHPLLVSKERRSETLHLRLHTPCFYPTLSAQEIAYQADRRASFHVHQLANPEFEWRFRKEL